MSEWSHLPNAHHIDRVIESSNKHPEIWVAAWASAGPVAWDAAWGAAWDAAGDAAWSAAKNAAWYAAVKTADRENAAWYAARNATLALISYDDSAKYLDMPSEKLRMWYILSEDPAAILLLPAVIAFEKINELECV